MTVMDVSQAGCSQATVFAAPCIHCGPVVLMKADGHRGFPSRGDEGAGCGPQ